MGNGGFSNESFEKRKRGEGARHGKFDDEKKSSPGVSGERYRVEKKDVGKESFPLKQGSLNEDTVDFLAGVADLSEWTPGLEESLVREGFVKDSKDVDGNRRVYSYPVPAGGLKDFAFTPEEALKILRGAVGDEDIIAKSATPTISGVEGEGRILNTTVEQNVPETKKNEAASYIEERQESLLRVLITIPGGKHLVVDTVAKGMIRVSEGAKLTIEKGLLGGKVIVEKGGEFVLRGSNLKGEVIYEDTKGVSEVSASAVEAMASPEGAQKKESDKVLADAINKGVEAIERERLVVDVSSIPLSLGKLGKGSVNDLIKLLEKKLPTHISAKLLRILKNAGYTAVSIPVVNNNKDIPQKARISLIGDASRVWELTQEEIIDLLKRHIDAQEKTPSVTKSEMEITTNSDELTDVDESGAINPYGVGGVLEKSDQGVNVTTQIQESNAEQNVLDDMGIESVPQAQSDTGFGLAGVDEFETSSVLSGEKLYSEKDIAESLEDDRTVDLALNEEKKIDIQKKLENDLTVKWFEKEAFDYPERYDAVWDRFVATHPEKALLYREHNPGIRSALERKEEKKSDTSKQEVEQKNEKQKFFDTRFETEFGITEEQISQIEGYERLSEGQQKLVLENLREYARDTRGGYLSRAWEGILKATGREVEDKNYIEAVTTLIRNTAQFGPKVHEENGELLVDLVGDIKFNREHRAEEKAVVDRFNALAHEYAKIKASNFEENTGTKRKSESKIVSIFKNIFSESRQEFDTTEYLYENAKQELVKVLSAQGMSEGQIAEKLVQIDSKVHGLRFLQTEPEAVDVLKQNPDKGFWQNVGEKVFSKENMAYAGLGFVGRMALTGAMGLYAAPAVASVLGGVRSWNKTSAELREKDRMARGGTRDISGEALNIVDVTREIKVGQDGKKDVGLTQKLLDLIREYQNEDVKEGSSGGEKTKTLERIRARVAYVEDKLNLNRINFGSGAERATNMASLFEALGEARVLLADTEMPKGSELEGRLERYLISREGLIQTRRRKKQIKTAVWGTLKAGALAFAGRELAEYVKESSFFNKEGSVVSGVMGTASVTESTETLPSKQYGYQSEVPAGSNEIVKNTIAEGDTTYTIKRGDTLTKILKEQTPSIKGLGNTQAQENAVANILRSLTREELDRIGLESHSIGVIKTGESINVEELRKIVAEKQSIIDSAQGRFGGEPVRPYTEASPKVVDVTTPSQEEVTTPSEVRRVGDVVFEQQAEDASMTTGETAKATIPDYTEDGGTPLDTESSVSETKVTQEVAGSPEVFTNTHGVEVDVAKPNIYTAKTIDGKEILISHGGTDLKSRVDEAYAYAEKNPGTTVYVEGASKTRLFGPNLPAPMTAITAPTGVVKDVDLNIMDFKMKRAFTGDLDPDSLTERHTKR